MDNTKKLEKRIEVLEKKMDNVMLRFSGKNMGIRFHEDDKVKGFYFLMTNCDMKCIKEDDGNTLYIVPEYILEPLSEQKSDSRLIKDENFHKPEEFKGKLDRPVFVETCGQSDHQGGCYIRFTNNKPVHSKERSDIVVDYDKNDKIVGIEFWDGFKREEII